MGTNEVRELQKAIKDLCARVGWSQKALARHLHYELSDNDNEKEIRRAEERIKKDLSRESTDPERLRHYLEVIRHLPDIQKAGLVIPMYHPSAALRPELENALTELSAEISRKLVDREK